MNIEDDDDDDNVVERRKQFEAWLHLMTTMGKSKWPMPMNCSYPAAFFLSSYSLIISICSFFCLHHIDDNDKEDGDGDGDEEKKETPEWALTDFQLQYPVKWAYQSILFTSLICLHFPFAMFALLIEVKILIDFPSNQHESPPCTTKTHTHTHISLI